MPSKTRVRGKLKRQQLAARAVDVAAYRGLDQRAREWLAKNPSIARTILEQEQNRRWRNGKERSDIDDVLAAASVGGFLLPRAPRPKPARGRRSSASKGAALLASGTTPKPKERRHIERALHDQLIARLFGDVRAFYDKLRTTVPRPVLDSVLERIAAYYAEDDDNFAHPLRETPLLRDASRIGRAASRSMVHMRGERGRAPNPATTRLMGTAFGILCGGEPARVWTTTTTRLAQGMAANIGVHSGRMLRTSIDLLAKKYLDIAYAEGSHHAALAFTGKLVGRSKGGVISSLTRATVSPS